MDPKRTAAAPPVVKADETWESMTIVTAIHLLVAPWSTGQDWSFIRVWDIDPSAPLLAGRQPVLELAPSGMTRHERKNE